jgi:putative two-component system response regulator
MVTGRDDPDLVDTTLELGAYGYITKPFAASELLHNLANAAKRRELELARHGERDRLADELERRTVSLLDALARLKLSQQAVSTSREELNRRLFHALELRDHDTAMHAERVSGAAALVAERIGLTADHCARIRIASMLHDVGKLAVPDRILRKPGPLTAEERAMVEYHTELGRELLSGSGDEVLEVAAAVAWAHHERFDGTGYPRGLQGAAIPLEARIVAVADVFDALLCERPYRGALALPHALELMARGRRIWFDPDPLDAFLDSIDEVLAIRGRQHPESPTRTQGG